jgi:CRISPR-associated protein Cas1
MDRNYHVFSDGRLERKDDTVRLVAEDDKKYLPIENAEAIFLHGQVDFNTRLMRFLNDHGVALHVFGWNDAYAGSITPKRGQTSGRTVVEQVRAYDASRARLSIAQEIVGSSIHNMRANVRYYNNRDHDLDDALNRLDETMARVDDAENIETLMGVEATARKAYYGLMDEVLPGPFVWNGRTYNPPDNELNSLISYANSLLYATCVSAIRTTALDPAISFLHEPGERRFSLALDLADIFKPVISDRVIFRTINTGSITLDSFRDELNGTLLEDKARKTFTKAFEETLERTVEHPDLRRHVSYQYLLRLEAYKLKKHLVANEAYEGFRRWW